MSQIAVFGTGRQRHAGYAVESRDTRTSSPGTSDVTELSHRPSGSLSKSHVSDTSSKPPPVAAKPRVRDNGQSVPK